MGFQEDLSAFVQQIRDRVTHIHGEEATKHALVVPFLQILGFDVFNPTEVIPEYAADLAKRKGSQPEKVDYAICIDGKIAMFVECKAVNETLTDHGGQLARYFGASSDVKVAVLTNGTRWQVFSDLQKPNVMDPVPWLDIELTALKPAEIEALKKLRKLDFAPDQVISLAQEMVFYNAISGLLATQLREPSESFVRWVAKEIPAIAANNITQKVLERLGPILRKALQASILDHVTKSLSQPVDPAPEPGVAVPKVKAAVAPSEKKEETDAEEPATVASPEEISVFTSMTDWIKEINGGIPIAYRDGKTYFTLHQANTRRWFVRLSIDAAPRWVAFRHLTPEELKALAPGLDELAPKPYGDSRVAVRGLEDIPKLRSAVIAAAQREAARVHEDAPVAVAKEP